MTRYDPCCIICRQFAPHREKGLVLRGNYICQRCEWAMATCVPEHPRYAVYISGLKKMWRLLSG